MLADKSFPIENFGFQLFLSMIGKLESESGSEIRHSDSVKRFFKVGYRLFHNKFIQYMRGYGKDEFNFIVPDKKTFLAVDALEGIDPSSLKPGFIESMFDLFEEDSVVKIAVDGKKINACKDQKLGKIHLWGHEKKPTATERASKLQKEHALVDTITEFIERYEKKRIKEIGSPFQGLTKQVRELISTLSNIVKDFREVRVITNRRLLGLLKQAGEPWHKSRLALAISGIKTQVLHMDNNIDSNLQLIDKLCHFLAIVNGRKTWYCTGAIVDMKYQGNIVCLGSDILSHVADDDKKHMALFMSELVKQRTEDWHGIRNMAKGTGSTLHRMVGLESLKGMKQHFDQVMNKKQKEGPSPDLQSRFQHGTQNEPNCIATLVGKVLPALFPDVMYYELGCYVMDEDDAPFVVVSPEGSGRNIDDEQKISFAFELKCPMPDKVFTTPVHYKIPVYYVPQLLAEMHVLDTNQLLFLSYTSESTSVLRVKFDAQLWDDIYCEAKRVYLTEKVKPYKLSKAVHEIRDRLKSFCETNVEFVAEVPSVRAVLCNHSNDCDGQHRHYHTTPDNDCKGMTLKTFHQSVLSVHRLLDDAHMLTSPLATEIVVFMMSDLNRSYDPEKPHAVPVAYGLRGYSMTQDVMRKMIDDVLKKAKEKKFKVLVTSSDGESFPLAITDSDGLPLTKLKLMKEIWKETDTMKKDELIQLVAKSKKISQPKTTDDIKKQAILRRQLKTTEDTEQQAPDYLESAGSPNLQAKGSFLVQSSHDQYSWPTCDSRFNWPDNQIITEALSSQTENLSSTELRLDVEIINRSGEVPIDEEATAEDILDNMLISDPSIESHSQQNIMTESLTEESDKMSDEMDGVSTLFEAGDDNVPIFLQQPIIDAPCAMSDGAWECMHLSMLTSHKIVKKEKWKINLEVFKSMLQSKSAEEINKAFTKDELFVCLKAIDNVIELKIGSSSTKYILVNIMCSLVGDRSALPLKERKKRKMESPKSLNQLATACIKYKISVRSLKIFVSNMKWLKSLNEWTRKALVKDNVKVHGTSQPESWFLPARIKGW